MKPINNKPPRLALVLLNKCLPDSVNDDISGDLIEEFNQSDNSNLVNQYLFWRNTLSTCWRYSMNKQLFLSLGMSAVSLTIFYMLIKAVVFLSVADDPLFYKDYWMNGDIHLLFVEDFFWSYSFGSNAYELDWGMLVNDWSVIWSIISYTVLHILDRRHKFRLFGYVSLAFVVCFTPYFYGMLILRFNDVPLTEVGPLVAFMWISIIYLILPLSYGLITKMHHHTSTILA
ncbi:MAG: hypothetical protein ACI9LX_002344 [Paraglaciecola sp.]|jgi:hypothetical protein